jgi:hypothetical protein
VRQARQEPRRGEQAEGRGKGGQRVEDGEGQHQPDQQHPFAHPGTGHGQHRRADDHAKRIGADRIGGLGLGHAQIGGEIRHQRHGREFRRADGEPTHGEGEQNRAGRDFLGRAGYCGGRRVGRLVGHGDLLSVS